MNNCIAIDSQTWRIEDGFVRFFLMVGTNRAIMIDSGMTKPDAKQICESLTDLPITLINTHGDRDHVSGTGAFDEIHIGMEDFENCGLSECFPATKPIAISDGEVFDLGGRTLRAISIPGHTKGSFAFLDAERRMLFTGDTVQDGDVFMFGAHRDRDCLASSLQKLVDLRSEYDTVNASHGTPILPGGYPERVLASWNSVLRGEISCADIEMHGTPVKLYKTETCGFILPFEGI